MIDIGFVAPYWGWDHFDWDHHRIRIDRDRFYRIEGHHRPVVGDTWQHDPYHRRGVAYRDPGTATRFGRSVSAPPDARRAYRGYESGSGIVPLNELRRPSTTGGAGTQGTLPNRLPAIQRPQGTVFDGYGHGRPSTTGGAGTRARFRIDYRRSSDRREPYSTDTGAEGPIDYRRSSDRREPYSTDTGTDPISAPSRSVVMRTSR